MFQQQKNAEVHTCPQCSRELISHDADLVCSEHGAFFLYGPQLLVRRPASENGHDQVALPWEKKGQ